MQQVAVAAAPAIVTRWSGHASNVGENVAPYKYSRADEGQVITQATRGSCDPAYTNGKPRCLWRGHPCSQGRLRLVVD